MRCTARSSEWGHRIWHDTDLTVYIIVKRGRQHTQRLEHDTRPGPYDRLDPPTIGATATGGALLQCVCTSCGTHAAPAGLRRVFVRLALQPVRRCEVHEAAAVPV